MDLDMVSTTTFQGSVVFLLILHGALLAISGMYLITKNSYIILKTHSNYLTMIQISFGVLDIWGSIISINRTSLLAQSTTLITCLFWGYWLQYCMGLIPWLSFQQYKILHYGFTFNNSLRRGSRFRRFGLGFFCILLINFPVICTATTYAVKYFFSSDGFQSSEFCGFPNSAKMSLALSILAQFLILYLVTLFIYKNIGKIHSEFYNCNCHIIYAGFCIFCYIFICEVPHFRLDFHWKLTGVCLKGCFYLFVVLRSFGYSLYKGIQNDLTYLTNSCNSFVFYDVIIDSISDIHYSKKRMEKFINWLQSQQDYENKFQDTRPVTKKNKGQVPIVSAKDLVETYKKVIDWKKSFSRADNLNSFDLQTQTDQLVNIVTKKQVPFVSLTLQKQITQKKDKLTPALISKLERAVIQIFDYYWGVEYIYDIYSANDGFEIRFLEKSETASDFGTKPLLDIQEKELKTFKKEL